MGAHKVVVAGAGIGGLAAAVALVRAGFEVEVFERAPALSEVGAGITVQANAVAALRELGLDEPVVDAGVRVRTLRLGAAGGPTYAALDMDALGLDAPSVAIHRAVLHDILYAAAGRDRVRLGCTVTGYRRDGNGAVLLLEGGAEISADAVVGADGIRSALRAQIVGDGEPRYAGYTCWRGVTPNVGDIEPGEAFEWWGLGRRIGGVHIDPEQLYWFAPVNAPSGGSDAPGGARAAVSDAFSTWPAALRRILEDTPEDAIVRNDVVDRPFASTWGDGPVTLLGDAAHPMTPNMGQGACQAIEDAVVLGRCLGDAGGDLAAGMRAYEVERRARAQWFVRRSWTLGRVAHWTNPFARAMRRVGMALTPHAVVVRSTRRAQTFPH